MEAGQEAGEIGDEHAASGRELVVTEDAARERLPGHAPHHEAGGAEARAVVVGEHLRDP